MRTVRKNAGYSLIELIATIMVISIGLGSLYAVMYRGLGHMRTVSGKNYAVAAVTSELEIVKAMADVKLPANYAGPFLGEVDLSALIDGKGILRIEDYKGSGGRLKVVTASVQWTATDRKKSFSASTLVGNP